jgi:UDP-N-acetylmuramate dehydrogenase
MMAQPTSPELRGRMLRNEPMARHCSWRAGGMADLYYEPADKQDLASFIQTIAADQPITWVGLGSNLLVRDGGIRGVTISVLQKLARLDMLPDRRVFAEAGVTCARFARFCQKHGLSGADFLAGIPGTIGGALAMNAGAFGYETWQFVQVAETMNRAGVFRLRKAKEFDIGYRSVSGLDGEWFSAGIFAFPDQDDEAQSRIRELLERRNQTQPIGQPSCGSVFKNPADDHAARLIESCGLKGQCIGGACVSEKHANFIINTGGAHGNDIEDLINHVQATVAEQTGVELHHEVRIVGER